VKKYTKVLALALALTMMLSMSVFAAGTIDTVSNKAGYTKTVTVTAPDGGSVAEKDKIKVTYNGDTENAMYLLLILEAGKSIPDKDNILYVNQETADANGDVTFGDVEHPVYPKDIVNSTIWLAGGDFAQGADPLGLTAVADIAAKVTVVQGDVTDDDKVTIADAVAIRRWLINKTKYPLVNEDAGDVTGDDKVTIADAVGIRRWLINKNKYPFQ